MNTNIERKSIIDALHKIEEFCRTDIVPEVKHSDRVSVDFGEKVYYHGWSVKEYKHSFTVCKNGEIFYRTGGLILPFVEDHIHDSTVYNSWTFAKDLILDWQEVKGKLFAKLRAQEEESNSIRNFTV